MGTIALITLIRSSAEDTPAGELVEQIRTAIQSSKIFNGWSIEKISILAESGVPEEELSPAPAKKTTSYGD